MKRIFFISILTLAALSLFSQKTIKGFIRDQQGKALSGVNIFAFGNKPYKTTANGLFSIKMPPDSAFLWVTFVCPTYRTKHIRIYAAEDSVVVKMIDMTTTIPEVIVKADKYGRYSNYAMQNIPLDKEMIQNNPTIGNDIVTGLAGTPNVQANGDDGRLLIQGGSADEGAYYIDGLINFNPYTTYFNLMSHHKISSSFLSGVNLQAGGYSGAYGNALSGTVQLHTYNELIDSKFLRLSASPNAMIDAEGVFVNKKQTFNCKLEMSYINLYPYYKVMKSGATWNKPYSQPSLDYSMNFKIKQRSIIKTLVHYHNSTVSLEHPVDSGYIEYFNQNQHDVLVNVAGDVWINDSWNMYVGSNVNYRFDNGVHAYDRFDSLKTRYINSHTKIEFNYHKTKFSNRMGAENIQMDYRMKIYHPCEIRHYNNNIISLYDELSLYLWDKINVNVGLRYNYTTYIRSHDLSPRFYLGYTFVPNHTIAVSTGLYSQIPSGAMFYTKQIKPLRSFNNTITYSYKKRPLLIQIDAYYKKYFNLILYDRTAVDYDHYFTNGGAGHAEGGSIFLMGSFLRDALNFHTSYSFVNSRRKENGYQEYIMPSYLAHHSVNATVTAYIPKLLSFIGISAYWNSGYRFYRYAVANDYFQSPYHFGLNASWTVLIKQWYVSLTCENITGRQNVYGYIYSGNDINYHHPVHRMDKRSIWLHVGVTLATEKDRLNYFKRQLINSMQ